MTRPLLLDLFCGAGGAAVGYHHAGFDVVGVDINLQPNYPFEFHQADALDYLTWEYGRFDAIHASPPCQHYSTASGKARNHHGAQYADLIADTRKALRQTGLPYIIENVANSPLIGSARLCGSTFGLNLRRHRYFETNWFLWSLPCEHQWQTPRFQSLDWSGMSQKDILASVIGVHGNCQYAGEFELRCEAMGIDWMTNDELVQAIPPRLHRIHRPRTPIRHQRRRRMNRQELRAHVRRERAQLTDELRPLQRRITEITQRLEELDKADDLLAGSSR